MANEKPAPKQIAFLQNRGIAAPPTKSSCRTLISFIVEGNGTAGATAAERIRIVIACQQRWLGQTIECPDGQGRVLYLFAKPKADTQALAAHFESQGREVFIGPFCALVELDSGKRRQHSLGVLKPIA